MWFFFFFSFFSKLVISNLLNYYFLQTWEMCASPATFFFIKWMLNAHFFTLEALCRKEPRSRMSEPRTGSQWEDRWGWFKWSVHVHVIDLEDSTTSHWGDDEGLERRPGPPLLQKQMSFQIVVGIITLLRLSHVLIYTRYILTRLWHKMLRDRTCWMGYSSSSKTIWTAHLVLDLSVETRTAPRYTF